MAEPAFDLLLERGDLLGAIRPTTARDTFRSMLPAAIELQAAGETPTDGNFGRFAGPGPDRVKRFFSQVDLEELPQTQLRLAVDEQVIEPPSRIVVESRTEIVTGPDKFGCVHMQPPPGLAISAPGRLGAPNTAGGISSAVALADCGDIVLPCGCVQIQQGWWHPDAWKGAVAPELIGRVEQELRKRAGFNVGAFVGTPREVAESVLGHLRAVDGLRAWNVKLDGVVLCGGRLRMGFPMPDRDVYGLGRQERYIGCDLRALSDIRAAGLVAFFELPQASESQALGRVNVESCDWSFALDDGTEGLDLAAVEGLLRTDGNKSPWRLIEQDLVNDIAGPGMRAMRLTVMASADGVDAVEVQLVFLLDFKGRRALYVSTMSDEEAFVAQLVRTAIREWFRQRPDSPIELSLRSLLVEGHLQTNQRRRAPDRRSYAGLAQTAWGVLQIARSRSSRSAVTLA